MGFAVLLICIEAQVAFVTLTVTVIPELIITVSVLVGTAAPPQVAVLFQFPDTDAVLCPKAFPIRNKQNNIKMTVVIFEKCNFIFILLSFMNCKINNYIYSTPKTSDK